MFYDFTNHTYYNLNHRMAKMSRYCDIIAIIGFVYATITIVNAQSKRNYLVVSVHGCLPILINHNHSI